MNLKHDLQLVLIQSPFANWEDKIVQELFVKMVALKKSGFGTNYTSPVLPVDTSDFVATHALLCRKDAQKKLLPMMGYRTISLEESMKNYLTFPGLSLVRNAKAPLHSKAVEDIMNRCQKTRRGLSYLGSWTVDQNFRQQHPEFKQDLREIFCVVYQALYKLQNISEVIIGGTLRFKTDQVFHQLGHRSLHYADQDLPPIAAPHLDGEPVLVMHAKELPQLPKALIKKWQPLWDHRMELGFPNERATKLKIVA